MVSQARFSAALFNYWLFGSASDFATQKPKLKRKQTEPKAIRPAAGWLQGPCMMMMMFKHLHFPTADPVSLRAVVKV